jgi:hypothetical protein
MGVDVGKSNAEKARVVVMHLVALCLDVYIGVFGTDAVRRGLWIKEQDERTVCRILSCALGHTRVCRRDFR